MKIKDLTNARNVFLSTYKNNYPESTLDQSNFEDLCIPIYSFVTNMDKPPKDFIYNEDVLWGGKDNDSIYYYNFMTSIKPDGSFGQSVSQDACQFESVYDMEKWFKHHNHDMSLCKIAKEFFIKRSAENLDENLPQKLIITKASKI